MWLVGGKENYISGFGYEFLARNNDFGLAFQEMSQSIGGGSVFAKSLALIEGEECDRAAGPFQ